MVVGAEWDSEILWPSLSEGLFSPWCRHLHPLLPHPHPIPPRPFHPLAPTGPPVRMEDTLSSPCTALWTGSLMWRLFFCGKGPLWFSCSLSPAWRTPGPSLVLTSSLLELASDPGLQTCRDRWLQVGGAGCTPGRSVRLRAGPGFVLGVGVL